MRQEYIQEMQRIVDQYVQVDAFNRLIKAFIDDKSAELSIWGDQCLFTHHMLGGQSPNIHSRAALVEMILLTLDIVDDLQDQDNHSKPWMTCPQGLAMNAVLALLVGVMGEIALLSGNKNSSPVYEVSNIVIQSINGQYMDLVNSVHSEEEYIHMVHKKSSSLIRLSYYMGYSDLDIPESVMVKMNELADCMGVIAQMENDLRDVVRADLKNDLLHKKRTFPILFLLNDEDDNVVKQYYHDRLTKEEFIMKKIECLQYIKASGCVEYTRVVQTLFQNRAKQIMDTIEAASPWKEKLKAISSL